MLEAYRKHEQERAAMGIPAKPLSVEQVTQLVELLKNPPADDAAFLKSLLVERVPPGVDEAAYVKAGFLTAIVKDQATSPLIDKTEAIRILGTMQGGYNIETLVSLLDQPD